jgi:FkbM family methyltransferase
MTLITISMFTLQDRPRRNVLVACDHGAMIVNRFDHDHNLVGQSQFLLDHGSTSTVEIHICATLLQNTPVPVIFDVGANIGTWTTWAARFWPHGTIHAFEPQHQVFQMLCGNCAINNLYNVHAHNVALGNQNTTITVNEPDYFIQQDFGRFSLLHDHRVKDSGRSMMVQIETLDLIMEKFAVPKIDLIKIDAEGMDIMVLRGALETIKTHAPFIFMEHHDTHESYADQIVELLESLRYRIRFQDRDLIAVHPSRDVF